MGVVTRKGQVKQSRVGVTKCPNLTAIIFPMPFTCNVIWHCHVIICNCRYCCWLYQLQFAVVWGTLFYSLFQIKLFLFNNASWLFFWYCSGFNIIMAIELLSVQFYLHVVQLAYFQLLGRNQFSSDFVNILMIILKAKSVRVCVHT